MTFNPSLSHQLNHLASLSGGYFAAGNPGGYSAPEACYAPEVQQAINRPHSGMAALENGIANLSNNVMYLSQQISMLAAELQRQSAQQLPGYQQLPTYQPLPGYQPNAGYPTQLPMVPSYSNVDAAQNARLANLDSKVKSLTALVAAYNRQLGSLIAIYRNSRGQQTVTQYPGQYDAPFDTGMSNAAMGSDYSGGYLGAANAY